MIKIAIYINDSFQKNIIKETLVAYKNEYPSNDFQIKVFSSAQPLLDNIDKKGPFDIYLLSIAIPELDGIVLGKKLKEKDKSGYIIYIDNISNFTLETFKVPAFNFLPTPVNQDEIFNLINELFARITKEQLKYILVSTVDGISKINMDDINYIELLKRRVCYHLKDGRNLISVCLRKGFSEASSVLLENECFIECGTKLVINFDQMSAIRNQNVVFKNESVLELPNNYISKLKKQWLSH